VSWCLLQISEFNPCRVRSIAPQCVRTHSGPSYAPAFDKVKQTHERTSGGLSNASARRLNTVANERTPAAIERRAAVSS
jgi:hypothetical protein